MVLMRDKVKVSVRIRPCGISDDFSLIKIDGGDIQIKEKSFVFDSVFDGDSSQKDIFSSAVAPLLKPFSEGVNTAILVYGQTGSGKTFTMGTSETEGNRPRAERGIIPRFIEAVFGLDVLIKNDASISIQFLELYNEEVRDLLHKKGNRPPIRLIDDKNGVVACGLSSHRVASVNEAMMALYEGSLGRTTGATFMNAESSRSHAIFTVILNQCINGELLSSKFNFVDLAGSERLNKTNAVGARAKEGICINYGLLALGNVINALSKCDIDLPGKLKRHIPYRDSKLTRLLEDSLGGNSKCLMIACISPSSYNILETINTLNYATRVKFIENKISVNQRVILKANNDVNFKRLQQRIMELEREVELLKRAPQNSPLVNEVEDILKFQKQSFESNCKDVGESIDSLCSLLSQENDLMIMENIPAQARLSNNKSLYYEKMRLQQKIKSLREDSLNRYSANNQSMSTVDHFVLKSQESIKTNSLKINNLIIKKASVHKQLSKSSCLQLRWKYLLNFISKKYILTDCLYKEVIKQYQREMSKLYKIIQISLSTASHTEILDNVMDQIKLQNPPMRSSISNRKTPILAMNNLEKQLDYLFPLDNHKDDNPCVSSQSISAINKDLRKDVHSKIMNENIHNLPKVFDKDNVCKTLKRNKSILLSHHNIESVHHNQRFVKRGELCIPIIDSAANASAKKIIKRAHAIIDNGNARFNPLSMLTKNLDLRLDYIGRNVTTKKPECKIDFMDNFRRRNLAKK